MSVNDFFSGAPRRSPTNVVSEFSVAKWLSTSSASFLGTRCFACKTRRLLATLLPTGEGSGSERTNRNAIPPPCHSERSATKSNPSRRRGREAESRRGKEWQNNHSRPQRSHATFDPRSARISTTLRVTQRKSEHTAAPRGFGFFVVGAIHESPAVSLRNFILHRRTWACSRRFCCGYCAFLDRPVALQQRTHGPYKLCRSNKPPRREVKTKTPNGRASALSFGVRFKIMGARFHPSFLLLCIKFHGLSP